MIKYCKPLISKNWGDITIVNMVRFEMTHPNTGSHIAIDVPKLLFLFLAVCSRSCGRGRCVKPNLCLCDGGQKSATCTSPPTSLSQGNS